MIRTGELKVSRYSSMSICRRGGIALAQIAPGGESRLADLVLLSLQLCLGSDSRHVSLRTLGPLSAQSPFARCSDENSRMQNERGRSVTRREDE